MADRFLSCLTFTANEEGGYVDDPRDAGNWSGGRPGVGRLIGSNMGVGAPALCGWLGPKADVTPLEMRNLSPTIYKAIAGAKYWSPLCCGDVPPGLDLMLFDFGWNRGVNTSLSVLSTCLDVRQATIQSTLKKIDNAFLSVSAETLLSRISPAGLRTLQKSLEIPTDGILGPQTIRAFASRDDLRVSAVILALAAAQEASYRRLFNFGIYGAGWLARTARRQSYALQAAETPTQSVKSELILAVDVATACQTEHVV